MSYGIWYDDGKLDFGWVQTESGNGRTSRFEDDQVHAESHAEMLRHASPWLTCSVEPLDGDGDERFKRVHRLALEKRLADAEKTVAILRDLLGR